MLPFEAPNPKVCFLHLSRFLSYISSHCQIEHTPNAAHTNFHMSCVDAVTSAMAAYLVTTSISCTDRITVAFDSLSRNPLRLTLECGCTIVCHVLATFPAGTLSLHHMDGFRTLQNTFAATIFTPFDGPL